MVWAGSKRGEGDGVQAMVWLAIAALIIAGCRDGRECFGTDECPASKVCRAGVCVGRDAGARPDGAGEGDGGRDAASDAGPNPDAAPRVDASVASSTVGRPLEDDQGRFGDVLLFHFDEGAASTLAVDTSDLSRLGWQAACDVGCPRFGVEGRYGAAVEFDGADDGLSFTFDPNAGEINFGRGAYTIEAWVKMPAAPSQDACIFRYEIEAGSGEMGLYITPEGRLRVSAMPPTAMGNTNVADGAWHHVAVVRDTELPSPDRALFYVDGLADGIGTLSTATVSAGHKIWIGRDVEGANFPGRLDELRVSGRPLTPDEFSIGRTASAILWTRGDDIWIAEERGSNPRLLIAGGTAGRWSSDGKEIAFLRCSVQGPGCDLEVIGRDGNGSRTLVRGSALGVPPAWSLDGRFLYYLSGSDCQRTIRRVEAHAMGSTPDDVQAHLAEGDYEVIDLAPTYLELRQSSVFVRDDRCGNGSVIRRFGVRGDGTLNNPQPIVTSTVTDIGWLRVDPFQGFEILYEFFAAGGPRSRIFGVDVQGLGLREFGLPQMASGERQAEWGHSELWIYYVGVPDDAPLGNDISEIFLFSVYNGGSPAQITKESTTSNLFPDYTAR